jgi:hypothetical protein
MINRMRRKILRMRLLFNRVVHVFCSPGSLSYNLGNLPGSKIIKTITSITEVCIGWRKLPRFAYSVLRGRARDFSLIE